VRKRTMVHGGRLHVGRRRFPVSDIVEVEVGYENHGNLWHAVNGAVLLGVMALSAYSVNGRWDGNAPGGVTVLSLVVAGIIFLLLRMEYLLVERVLMTIRFRDGTSRDIELPSYGEAHTLRDQLEERITK